MKNLAIFIFSGFFFLPSTLANAGVLKDKNCGSCHRLNATEKSFTGPDLHYAGSKFQPEWLSAFLKRGEVIRPAGFITDPGFLKGPSENRRRGPCPDGRTYEFENSQANVGHFRASVKGTASQN
jgi:hypothetical protein